MGGHARWESLWKGPLPPSPDSETSTAATKRYSGRGFYPQPGPDREQLRLLDGNLGAGVFEDLLDLLGLILGNVLFDGLRSALDEVLRFLQAERGDLADGLDDVDLLLAGALENDGELGLDLRGRCCGGGTSGRRGGDGGGSGGDAEALFERLDEVRKVKDRHRLNLLHEIFGRNGHFILQKYLVLINSVRCFALQAPPLPAPPHPSPWQSGRARPRDCGCWRRAR